jgi:hypothetical protein
MILSKGREAFTGDVKDAAPYFDSIGYPLPVQTNPGTCVEECYDTTGM